jgi:membrane associated rhomboid family serine protease
MEQRTLKWASRLVVVPLILVAVLGFATAQDFGDLGQIAIAAHIGGFLVGLLLTRPLLRWRFRSRTKPSI